MRESASADISRFSTPEITPSLPASVPHPSLPDGRDSVENLFLVMMSKSSTAHRVLLLLGECDAEPALRPSQLDLRTFQLILRPSQPTPRLNQLVPTAGSDSWIPGI